MESNYHDTPREKSFHYYIRKTCKRIDQLLISHSKTNIPIFPFAKQTPYPLFHPPKDFNPLHKGTAGKPKGPTKVKTSPISNLTKGFPLPNPTPAGKFNPAPPPVAPKMAATIWRI